MGILFIVFAACAALGMFAGHRFFTAALHPYLEFRYR